jgi:mycothiol synthase
MGFDIVVHPKFRRQGLGTALLGLVREKAQVFGSSRVTCPVFVSTANPAPPGSLFLHQHGFRTDHGYWQMRIDRIGDLSPAVWPSGIGVRSVSNLETDVETWCRLVIQAFGEDATPSGVLAQMHETGASPSGYFFAVDQATRLEIGSARARIDISDDRGIGYVGTVGVLPEYRRRGIAEALVRHALSYLVGLGLDSATLFVEKQNLAARRIYDAMGWYPVYCTDHYWRAAEPSLPSMEANDGRSA